MEGMKREKEELDKIINNEEEPTFDNTIIYKDETKGEALLRLIRDVLLLFFRVC